MAEPEDLAKGIAENIGYMPLVNKAGEMGSGFMDFLSNLLPSVQGGREREVAAQPKPATSPDFLSGLWNAITSGAQSTADAFNRDVSKVSEGKLPPELGKDLSTALMMTGRGGFGPGLAKIPATRTVQRVFDPAEGWKEINEVVTPSVDPIKSLFLGNLGGSRFSDLMLKILQGLRENQKGGGIPETLRY